MYPLGRKSHKEYDSDTASLIRQFAAADNFRSAKVEELELSGDYFRRPLRSEDLAFIDFGVPVVAETICDLPSLAAQRILRCIYDMQTAGLPRNGDLQALQRRADFYSDQNRIEGARLESFLEGFAFGFLEEPPVDRDVTAASLCKDFERYLREAQTFARTLAIHFQSSFSKPNLRFVLVQNGCLGLANRLAIDRARAAGFFDVLPHESGRPPEICRIGNGLENLMVAMDVNTATNRFWQFYLPTTLAAMNYLSGLATRPGRSLAMIGATFIAAIEWQSFVWMARKVGEAISSDESKADDCELTRTAADAMRRFEQALSAVEAALGRPGCEELSRGVRAAGRLAQLSHQDLETQLRWLAGIDDYVEIARRVSDRIRVDQVNIARDTFVEPREMCSTTHVHNDNRLVVIESGAMVFWGCPDMRYQMKPGDMILVPRGRLHGSAVTSDQCIYHQPIIPEEWVRPLIDEVDRRHDWPVH